MHLSSTSVPGVRAFPWWKPALFFLVVIAGLWYVKWQPYYGKAFTAAHTHSLGKSILAQANANPFNAALDYAMVYFLAVWKAAGLGVALLVQRWVKDKPQHSEPIPVASRSAEEEAFLPRWGKALWQLFWSTIPVYVLAVLALGAARVWLFPHADSAVGDTLFWVIAMAVVGCLFVIPTAAEIPVVQTMILAGMGTAPALALLITLPAVSLPSLIMLHKTFPAKALWLTGGLVALSGIIVGSLALL